VADEANEDGELPDDTDLERLLGPLRALGYGCRVGTLEAEEWCGMRRTRLFVLLYRLDDPGACGAWEAPDEGFRLAVSPDAREVTLSSVILPPFDAEKQAAFSASGAPESSRPCAPYACYSVAKQEGASGGRPHEQQSQRFDLVEQLGRQWRSGRSHVAVHNRRQLSIGSGALRRVKGHARGGFRRRDMAATIAMSTSRHPVLRDLFGPRTFCGLEAARLFGYPDWATDALYSAAGSSDKVLSFIGDVSSAGGCWALGRTSCWMCCRRRGRCSSFGWRLGGWAAAMARVCVCASRGPANHHHHNNHHRRRRCRRRRLRRRRRRRRRPSLAHPHTHRALRCPPSATCCASCCTPLAS
jgi:hypothetical protein